MSARVSEAERSLGLLLSRMGMAAATESEWASVLSLDTTSLAYESVTVSEWDRLTTFSLPLVNWSTNVMLCASVLSLVVSLARVDDRARESPVDLALPLTLLRESVSVRRGWDSVRSRVVSLEYESLNVSGFGPSVRHLPLVLEWVSAMVSGWLNVLSLVVMAANVDDVAIESDTVLILPFTLA